MKRSDLFNIATTMHMANYVSRRINIVCLIFRIRAFFITTFFAWLFVMLLSLIQIGIQKIYCSSFCFLFIVLSTIFVFLSLFQLVVVLSISLKEQFEDIKGVVKTRKWKNGHYNDKQLSMKHYTAN